MIIWERASGEIPETFQMGKNGHPFSFTYRKVFYRYSFWIILKLDALDLLTTLGLDIQDTYLAAPNKYKVYLYYGKYFESLEGILLIIAQALYGLIPAGGSLQE